VGDVYIWSEKTPTKVDLPEKVKRVSIGQKHTCIVGESGYNMQYVEICILMALISMGNLGMAIKTI
jgi:hypothetical protein